MLNQMATCTCLMEEILLDLPVLEGVSEDSRQFRRAEKHCRHVYDKHVNTYNDLLLTNIAFFHNRFVPFYYGALFASEDQSHMQSVQTLIKLHEYGVYTINGQANTCDEYEMQRPYVEGFLPAFLADAVLSQLKKFENIAFYQVERGGKVEHSNFEYSDVQEIKDKDGMQPVLVVTKERGDAGQAWKIYSSLSARPVSLFAFKGLNFPYLQHTRNLLTDNMSHIQVIMKEYCSPLLADALLLQCVEATGVPVRVTDPFTPPIAAHGYSLHEGVARARNT